MAGVEVLAMTTQKDGRVWADELAALSTRISPHFSRREPRQRAVAYLRGLLAPIERKNGWQLAEAAGDRTPDGVQDFLARICRTTADARAGRWRCSSAPASIVLTSLLSS